MTKYIPKIGSITIPEVIEERTINGWINKPAPGTRLRLTMPGTETVIVGEVGAISFNEPAIQIRIDGEGYSGFREIALWADSGWEFEILAPVEVDRELVDA